MQRGVLHGSGAGVHGGCAPPHAVSVVVVPPHVDPAVVPPHADPAAEPLLFHDYHTTWIQWKRTSPRCCVGGGAPPTRTRLPHRTDPAAAPLLTFLPTWLCYTLYVPGIYTSVDWATSVDS